MQTKFTILFLDVQFGGTKYIYINIKYIYIYICIYIKPSGIKYIYIKLSTFILNTFTFILIYINVL